MVGPGGRDKKSAMDPAQMMAGLTRETDIRRDRRGRWWKGSDPIDHPHLVRAFERWLDRAEDGRFCLRNDINWAYVEVEGPPVFVRGVRAGEEGLRLVLSGEVEEPLDPATLRQDSEGALYCDVREGRLAAVFDRYAADQLVELTGEMDEEGPFLRFGGERLRPRVVPDPLCSAGVAR